ncbi:MerR family transcriptional regulator [Sphaerisporangium corydalis]|uniref:MerR family transcriptional regulator n=1 Tax=Sphaerisporangium corydalis TaxID=1441875 RepID=A0ABV9EBS1_9ACTN|nr:MerR family transcriptional regulator [Sphaerisporangium corydalis]
MRVDERRWRVGELATATGLTVRALHYFDEIGLVRPAGRSAAGHRLYTAEDVTRLYRVVALRHLGMPLAGIAGSLDGDMARLETVLRAHIAHVDQAVATHRRSRRRLDALLRALEEGGRQPSIDRLIETMEETMKATHFTPEQLARLKHRHQEGGDQGFAAWFQELGEIAGQVGERMRQGADPADPDVQALARAWSDAVDRMIGGDTAVLSAMYAKIDAKGPEAATRGLLTTEVWEYLKRAFAIGFAR